jgi:hypothetical protein
VSRRVESNKRDTTNVEIVVTQRFQKVAHVLTQQWIDGLRLIDKQTTLLRHSHALHVKRATLLHSIHINTITLGSRTFSDTMNNKSSILNEIFIEVI